MPDEVFIPGGPDLGQPPSPPAAETPAGPPPGAPAAQPSGKDTAIFVCGLGAVILGLGTCCCGIFGLILAVAALGLGLYAWIAGTKERRRCQEEGRQPHGLLTAGWILGIVGTILSLLAAITAVVYLLIWGAALSLSALGAKSGA